ncbi:MAG: ATP-binding protein [Fibrobacteraceae bacterium]|nr:ATP-binding protein [Fibrobacteraceae bacterium]
MIPRLLQKKLVEAAKHSPVITLTGPRQSGKTTLARAAFPKLPYVNLEPLDTRAFAREDSRGFLARYPSGAILDEIQNVPELLSYLQEQVDAAPSHSLRYLLTGSRNFSLMQSVSQSLAGRSLQMNLLPFSHEEIKTIKPPPASVWEFLWKGGYPRLYDGAKAGEWLPSYIENYIERDVRSLAQVGDLGKFQTFLLLCAGRIGQMLNLSQLGNEAGIDHKTAARWISILEASYIVFLLRPYHENFSKRLVKTPKLYFWDTGLACSLLRIRTATDLDVHFARGSLFENLAIVERLKHQINQGERPEAWFFRDSTGLEVDLLENDGHGGLQIYEIKSSQTIHPEMFSGLKKLQAAAGDKITASHLIYTGSESYTRSGIRIHGI